MSSLGTISRGWQLTKFKSLSLSLDKRDSSFAGEDVLMLMPGVAFDESRNRVGYKGGFYDRYLERHPEIRTLALAFDCQILDETIEADSHDIKPHGILTEKRGIFGG